MSQAIAVSNVSNLVGAQLSPAMVAARQAALAEANKELSGGITGGFAVVSLRGKTWRIKHRGEERVLLTAEQQPVPTIEIVLIKASANIAKIWYEKGYTEGSNAPPDCWSVDGRAPDMASPKRQSPACAGCPQNAWGSRPSQDGKGKGKACSDSKRIAIAPLNDIENKVYGGPMLLRIPPASLGDVKTFADKLDQMGYTPQMVAIRVGFDYNAEYPRLMFSAIRTLTDDEFSKVMAMREDPAVERILNTAIDHVETDGVDETPGSNAMFEQPPAVPGARPVQQVQAPPPGVVLQQPVQQPVNAAGVPVKDFDPQTGEIPANPNPVQASVAQAAAVSAKVTGEDPAIAEKRAGMRKLGLDEATIIAVLGPEPEPVLADPNAEKRAQMKALGLTDEQIDLALGVAKPATAEKPAPKKTTKPKAAPAAVTPEVIPPAQMQAPAEPEQPQQTVEAAPQPTTDLPATGDTPEDFDSMLEGMLG